MAMRADYREQSLAERFWSGVDRSGDCWVWLRTKVNGYGRIRIGSRTDGSRRLALATHIAWELTNGPIPEGLDALHHCDNPPCVRPDHLFLGTDLDNNRDMRAKGRDRHPIMRGESCGHAKLTAAAVADIRRRVAAGEVQRSLAREYAVSPATVCCIVSRKRWDL